MHFVYICKSGNNEELRYSIRSVMKHAQNPSVSVVGGKPDWYKGHYIEVPQDMSKYRNAMNNIRAAIDSPDIPEDFILMNDDFFILKDIEEIGYTFNMTLQDRVFEYEDINPSSSYVSKLRLTNNKLIKMGIPKPLNYELHIPFPVNKDKLKTVLSKTNNPNVLWRSVYGNFHKVGGIQGRDVKVYAAQLKSMSYNYNEDSVFLSTEDNSFNTVKAFLMDRLPEPSFVEYN